MSTFKPYPKPEKSEKKKPKGYWSNGQFIAEIKPKPTSKAQKFCLSDGTKMTEIQIQSKLTKTYTDHPITGICQCCQKRPAEHHDHTISQRKCKLIKKVELIWNPDNWSLSCSKCHHEWESYKSGLFEKHANYKSRMEFVKKHHPEEFRKRTNYV